MPAGFHASIPEHPPRARSEVTYQPVELAPDENGGPEAAALVEVAAAGKTQQVWLKRADEQYGFRRVLTPEGPLLLSFGYEHVPLDFSLKLLDFRRGKNPGGKIDASFTSSVQLVDEDEGIDEKRKISIN